MKDLIEALRRLFGREAQAQPFIEWSKDDEMQRIQDEIIRRRDYREGPKQRMERMQHEQTLPKWT